MATIFLSFFGTRDTMLLLIELHADEKTDEEVIGLLRQRLMEVTFNQGLKQKVVPASEVEEWLAKGWAWKGNLGDGRAVLEPAI